MNNRKTNTKTKTNIKTNTNIQTIKTKISNLCNDDDDKNQNQKILDHTRFSINIILEMITQILQNTRKDNPNINKNLQNCYGQIVNLTRDLDDLKINSNSPERKRRKDLVNSMNIIEGLLTNEHE